MWGRNIILDIVWNMLKLIKGWSISAERLFNKKIVSPLPINVEMIWNSESPKPANK